MYPAQEPAASSAERRPRPVCPRRPPHRLRWPLLQPVRTVDRRPHRRGHDI